MNMNIYGSFHRGCKWFMGQVHLIKHSLFALQRGLPANMTVCTEREAVIH